MNPLGWDAPVSLIMMIIHLLELVNPNFIEHISFDITSLLNDFASLHVISVVITPVKTQSLKCISSSRFSSVVHYNEVTTHIYSTLIAIVIYIVIIVRYTYI